MCKVEGVNLQRGMNFRLKGNSSVILMSVRRGAPYADRVEDSGSILVYEGHDVPTNERNPMPKAVDQPGCNPNGLAASPKLQLIGELKFKSDH